MIIKIKSTNPHLLDILHKNPNTDEGLYLKKWKNGVLVGQVISQNEYHCVFQDTKYSYLPEDSNQIDFQSYCSPLLVLHILSEYFNHLYKDSAELLHSEISWLGKTYEQLDVAECIIEIPTFFIDSNWVRQDQFLLAKYVQGITVKSKTGYNYSLEIKGTSIIEAIQKLSMVALFSHFTNRYAVFTYITDDFMKKYIRIMTNIKGLPYFVFYLFIKRIVRSPEQFQIFKPELEAYFDQKVQFVFTDTHQSRKEFIASHIDFNQAVLDYGCGELQYFSKLKSKGFREPYWAYDEVDYEHVVNKWIDNEHVTNLKWVAQAEELIGFRGQVILSEVIEHNSLEDAKTLMAWIRDNVDFTKLMITTPDKRFNIHYEMDEEFRHDDHDFELSREEFETMINDLFPHTKTYYGVGDCVEGIYPTSAVIIEGKN